MWSKGHDLKCPSEGHRSLVPVQERLPSDWQTVTTCSVKSCQQLSIASHLLNQSWLLGYYYHSVERVVSVEHIPHVMWLLYCSHWICFQRFAFSFFSWRFYSSLLFPQLIFIHRLCPHVDLGLLPSVICQTLLRPLWLH